MRPWWEGTGGSVAFPQFASTAAAFLNSRGCLDRRGPLLSLPRGRLCPATSGLPWWLVR